MRQEKDHAPQDAGLTAAYLQRLETALSSNSATFEALVDELDADRLMSSPAIRRLARTFAGVAGGQTSSRAEAVQRIRDRHGAPVTAAEYIELFPMLFGTAGFARVYKRFLHESKEFTIEVANGVFRGGGGVFPAKGHACAYIEQLHVQKERGHITGVAEVCAALIEKFDQPELATKIFTGYGFSRWKIPDKHRAVLKQVMPEL